MSDDYSDLPVRPGGLGDGCGDLVRPLSAGDSRFERARDMAGRQACAMVRARPSRLTGGEPL
jgi:hypothetical protein